VSWRSALRSRALAMAVDAAAGDLRAGLGAAIGDADPAGASAAADGATDLRPWIAASSEAKSLWGRAVRVWLASLRR
jgi:hypothetical protein